ncbi:9-O-acetylesterase [Bacilli bacterium]|nr:9-O-acetylesterase [Bacilli bacterium]
MNAPAWTERQRRSSFKILQSKIAERKIIVLRLNPLITKGVVLQAEQPVLISGTTQSNVSVSLSFGDEQYQTQADETGKFLFELPAHAYGISGELEVTTEKADTLIISDVKFGEVFLLGGQSNIEFKMSQEKHFETVRDAKDFGQYDISYVVVPQVDYLDENGVTKPDDAKWQGWLPVNRESLAELSAVGYYAAIEWAKNHPDVPVGLVACNKGGTSVTTWLDEESLKASPLAQKYVVEPYQAALLGKTAADFDRLASDYRETAETYYALREKWVREHPELTLGEIKEVIGGSPWPPPSTPQIFTRPSGVYHTMFEGITPYTFKAVLWYQGEEDSRYPDMYAETLPILLKTWRRDLKSPDLPFYIVQLPIFDETPPKSWAGIRQAQLEIALADAHSHFIVTADTGDKDDVHPTDKSEVGKRIGEIINNKYYDNSPYAFISEHGAEHLILTIKNAETVVLKNYPVVISIDDRETSAKVKGNQLIINLKPDAKVVRYGWQNAPELSLFNEVGYPVSPFEFILSKEVE